MNEDQARAIGTMMQIGAIIYLIAVFAVGGSSRTGVEFVASNVMTESGAVPFEESLTARHWLAGLVKGEQPNLTAALAKHIRDGEQVSRLTVSTRTTGGNMLAAGFTLGIYCPQTVIVRGEIVGRHSSLTQTRSASR
jgi:hypothetical protein